MLLLVIVVMPSVCLQSLVNQLNSTLDFATKSSGDLVKQLHLPNCEVTLKYATSSLIEKLVEKWDKNDPEPCGESGSDQLDLKSVLGCKSQSDLIPNQYEGGFKVWECTNDLIQFIHQKNVANSTSNLKILEVRRACKVT